MTTKKETESPRQPATSDDFFDAVAQGNTEEAVDVLRRLDRLGPMDLDLLADLISGDASSTLFPYRFESKKRTAGKPSDPLARRAVALGFVRMIVQELERAHELTKIAKLESAINLVAERMKVSPSTVRRAWDQWPQKDRILKRFTNSPDI
jgi:hypothetical protein